ncbi:hypothetical protein ACYEXS_29825 [Paenibacillus sp. MAH-36]|uniref:Uncharacterized protein n=1 Tax=Paenibacillus violae TaxID=3077234 RepID=A0ABU3RQ56_9BACL|nr:hypothetical protein [Paenibacillus sp. PFR10]MDU0206410.1 hypothetical protein [Paenibacillus sp. PFR10]
METVAKKDRAINSKNGSLRCLFLHGTPSMGVIGVSREVESEGSWRQTHGLRYTNPI